MKMRLYSTGTVRTLQLTGGLLIAMALFGFFGIGQVAYADGNNNNGGYNNHGSGDKSYGFGDKEKNKDRDKDRDRDKWDDDHCSERE